MQIHWHRAFLPIYLHCQTSEGVRLLHLFLGMGIFEHMFEEYKIFQQL